MTATATTTYRVTFDRVGRNRPGPSWTIEAADADDLAEEIYNRARPMLGSRDVEVVTDLEAMTARIIVGGCRPGGTATIEPEGGAPVVSGA